MAPVTDVFAQSLAHNFDEALDMLQQALIDCPDDLWEADLWPDEAPTGPAPDGGLTGSAPWLLAHHALICLDYDLSGGFESWHEPPPFDESTWAVFPNRVFTRGELLGYIAYCRNRVRHTIDDLTEGKAARPLPTSHRYAGRLYGVLVGGMPQHTIEHATQIRQFLRAAGIKPSTRVVSSEAPAVVGVTDMERA
jgi:hypothetical protein